MRLFARTSLAAVALAPFLAACDPLAPPANVDAPTDSGAVADVAADAAADAGIVIPDSGSATFEAGLVDCNPRKFATRPLPDDPCTRVLEVPAGQSVDPLTANVVAIDGNGDKTTIVADATDGWTFDSPQNPQKIVLHGASCAAFKTADVELITACPPVP